MTFDFVELKAKKRFGQQAGAFTAKPTDTISN